MGLLGPLNQPTPQQLHLQSASRKLSRKFRDMKPYTIGFTQLQRNHKPNYSACWDERRSPCGTQCRQYGVHASCHGCLSTFAQGLRVRYSAMELVAYLLNAAMRWKAVSMCLSPSILVGANTPYAVSRLSMSSGAQQTTKITTTATSIFITWVTVTRVHLQD